MFKNARYAAAAVLLSVLAAPALAQDAPTAATVIARVGETEITLGQAIALRAQLPQQFTQVPDETLFPALVEQLIEQELLAQAQAGDLSLRDQLMLQNETRNFLANAALVQVATAAVTDESVQAAYDAFVADYAQGEPVTEYHAAHILVRSEEERDQVVAALAEGRDFAEVAQEFSADGSAQQGGDLGWFGPGVMIPEFQAAVEALEPGQVSEPVQTRFGWHVVKLLETRNATAPTLDQVREDLVTQIQREATRAYIEELRAASTAENLSEGMDPSLLSQTTLLDE
ncbi:peptidylprolyl isomerase [Pararhodobacter sp.]|uniref:peptidylprolyl isomerase n=1 Tax=Pararhodobacter sp. TaxID=2127056 RepID=UPI002AFE53DA|nr:peptidylprolyl isomerase [Pararhodobacter sp.]